MTKVIESTQSAPTAALSDWARQAVEGFVEAQGRWAEIAAQQSEQIIKSLRSGKAVKPSRKGAADQGIKALFKMRRDWLDFVARQNNQVIDVLKERLNIDESSPVAGLADLTQRAVNNYVEIQKRWLDLAMQLPSFGGAGRKPKE